MQYVVAVVYVALWFGVVALAALLLPRVVLPVALVQLAIAYVVVRAALQSGADGA